MKTPAPPSPFADRLAALGGWAGFLFLLIMGCVTPLVFMPTPLQKAWEFYTDRSEDLIVKMVFLQASASAVVIVGALMLLTARWRAYGGRVLVPVVALCAFLAWGLLAVAASPAPSHSLYYFLNLALPLAAALCGPLFASSDRRVRILLIGMVICGSIIAVIGILGSLGYREFNVFIYGQDPRDIIQQDTMDARRVQGGISRSAAISTLLNPEWAGSFAGGICALCAVLMLDWPRNLRRSFLLQTNLLFAGLLGINLLQLFFTGTRQPLLALALAGLLRVLIELRVPMRWAAAGFCTSILALFFLGAVWAGAVFAAWLVAAGIHSLRSGTLVRAIRAASPLGRVLFIGGPALVLLLLVAFSTPGPWNPTGLRILQRFSSIADPRDKSITERSMMFMAASEMTWEHPLLGVGPGLFNNQIHPAFRVLVERDESGVIFLQRKAFGAQIADQAHNDYLQIVAETGIPGLVLFLTAILFLLRELALIASAPADPRRLGALTLLACLAAFLVMMFTSFPLQVADRSAFFWTMVAASLGLIAADARPAEPEAGEKP